MRRGFSLITAIIILVIMATLMVLMLSLSSQSAKQTGDIYINEQTKLLARSATEFALLAISGHDRSIGNCLENINLTYPKNNPLYDINISIYYIGNELNCNQHISDNNIATNDSNGTIIIDTIVTSLQSDEPIRYHRRTIQKP